MSCGAAVFTTMRAASRPGAWSGETRCSVRHRGLHQRTLLAAQLRILELAAQQVVLSDEEPDCDEAQEASRAPKPISR